MKNYYTLDLNGVVCYEKVKHNELREIAINRNCTFDSNIFRIHFIKISDNLYKEVTTGRIIKIINTGDSIDLTNGMKMSSCRLKETDIDSVAYSLSVVRDNDFAREYNLIIKNYILKRNKYVYPKKNHVIRKRCIKRDYGILAQSRILELKREKKVF